MLKVLKAVAELKGVSLGDLQEEDRAPRVERKAPFSPQTMKKIDQFKALYARAATSQRQSQN